MSKGDRFILLLILIVAIIVFFGFKNQKIHTNPKNEPVPVEPVKIIPVKNHYIDTCTNGSGVLTDCEKGA